MKVIYDTYRRHRNNSNGSNNSNKNGTNNNDHLINEKYYQNNNNINNNNNNGPEFLETTEQHHQMGHHPNSSNYRHIISIDSLVINKELGIGEFGVVQQGVWTNDEGHRIQVAIKCLSAARLENSRLEFLKEATIMHSISHENIVTLYGVVLEPSFMLITELAPLRSLLECLKESTLITHFPLTSLCTFASQIADGMNYLESKRLIHRDLAARNILVFSKNKVKISDFGLSRALGVGKDYYQSNFNVNLKLPIAWCAPECINYLKFTSQSDVWAYGVTLWEMFSFGFQPWAALTGQQILEAIDQPNYQRLEKPECCPKEYYQLMLKCWTHEPYLRPKFSEIVTLLPDCKPELLQAIRNSSDNLNRKDVLSYKSGDIVTVIDKFEEDPEESLWKGVTNDRKTGLINPSDFVAYLGQNLPSSTNANSHSTTSFVQSLLSNNSNGNGHHSHSSSLASTITSTVLQSSKFLRGFLESKAHGNHQNNCNGVSPHGVRKSRLRPEMISKPQGDLKHTGHVGADGVFFGDVSFLEGKYHPVGKHSASSGDLLDSKSQRKLTISGPITNLQRNSSTDKVIYSNTNHEYHEISDEENNPLESPPFEVLDFGPSLMEEVFKELDHIRPDLSNEAAECETAINENSINVKNEVRELNLKLNKENNQIKKKQLTVKPISEAEQNELDSAIAMAKDIYNRTMLEDDLDLTKNDSPKTPNSPNKRKFTFKFPTHRSPKNERKTFSEETESIGNIIESITPEAKEAYMTLVYKGVSQAVSQNQSNQKMEAKLEPTSPTFPSIATVNSCNNNTNSSPSHEIDSNPLRMLRTAGIGKVLRPKVRGNRSFSQPRIPTTAQTAGLARVASSRSPPAQETLLTNGNNNFEDQSQSGSSQLFTASTSNNNALPLPPRDRSRPLIQLKTHQRRHPLVIPMELANSTEYNNNHHQQQQELNGKTLTGTMNQIHDSPPLIQRHVPVLKQVSCPQAPAAFLSIYNNGNANKNLNNSEASDNGNGKNMPPIPPKAAPARPFLSDDLTESIENEIQKAFTNMKIKNENGPKVLETKLKTQKSLPNSERPPPPPIPQSASLNSKIKDLQEPIPTTTTNPIAAIQTISPSTAIQTSVTTSQVSDVTPSNPVQPVVSSTSIPTTTQSATKTGAKVNSGKIRNIDSDEVRVMQKVLSNEINLTPEECAQILDSTDWDIHRAIKCIRLRQQLRSHNIMVECDWSKMLSKFNWNIRQASNYLIATQGVPEDTTEV